MAPKNVERFNEKIKTIHKNLCISLVYIHTTCHGSYCKYGYNLNFVIEKARFHLKYILCMIFHEEGDTATDI